MPRVEGSLAGGDAIGYAAIGNGQNRENTPMASFSFVDHWHLDAPIDAVWLEITDPLDWPSWWPSMQRVEEIEPGDAQGIGAVRRHTVKGALPYRVSFEMRTTVVEEHQRLEGEATGDVHGRGRWTFSGNDKTTDVTYEWIVDVTKDWMVLLAPIMRPLFGWNHHFVMRRGLKGLTTRLAARR